MFSQMGDGSKPMQDQRPFEPTANLFHCARHFGIPFGPSQRVIKYPDQFANILLPRFLFRDGTVEQIQQFDLELQPEPVDNDIVRMKVPMGLVQQMNFLNRASQRIKQVECLVGVESIPRKLFQKFR